MNRPRYKTLLRTLYGAALSSRLSMSDLKALSDELRRGQLADELAYMLDNALKHLGTSGEDEPEDERVAEAERLIRRRKVSKMALASIMDSLGLPPLSSKGSVRDMLDSFMSKASSSRVTNLLGILGSQQGDDEFLTGISKTRK